MRINFTQILQDCWNFSRNQTRLVWFFTLLFVLNSVVSNFFFIPMLTPELPTTDLQGQLNIQKLNEIPFLLISTFLTQWGMMSIHHLSSNHSLGQNASIVFKRIFGVIFINILISLPLVFSLSTVLASVFQQKQVAIYSSLFIIFGVFLFVRLCMASVHYLFEPVGVMQALVFTWKKGTKRFLPLFVYCLILNFILPLLLRRVFLFFSGVNPLLELVPLFLMAISNVFSFIFTYRFYTLFVQGKE